MGVRIVKIPGNERVGVVSAGSVPEVELEIDVIPRKGELIVKTTNPNLTKVELSIELELYRHEGFWRRLDPGIVFVERRIVLLPGETFEQLLPVDIRPGRYKIVRLVYLQGIRVRVEKEFRV